jgi:hypothetical protein
MPSRHEDFQILALGEFHRHIDGARNYRDLVIERDSADHLRGCSAGCQGNDLAVLDKRGGGSADTTLFLRESLHLCLERAIISKRLIE